MCVDTSRLFALKCMKFYLNSCGVAVGKQKDAKLFPLYKYYMLIGFSILTYGQLMLYQDVTDVPAFAQTTGFVLSAFYLNFCTLYVHFKQKELSDMMKLKYENFHTYPNYSYNLYGCQVDERFDEIVKKYGKIFIGVYAVVILTPLLMTPFSGYELGSPETLMIPCKFPWRSDTLVPYLLTYFLQVCCITPISIPVFGMVFFTVYFVLEVKAQAKRICSILEDIKLSSQREAVKLTCGKFSINENFDSHRYSECFKSSAFIAYQYDRISLEKLTQCLKHHQKIIKFIKDFVLCLEAMFLGNLIYSIGTITLSGYTLVGVSTNLALGLLDLRRAIEGILFHTQMKISKGVVDLSLYSQYVALICCALVYLLLYCHLGELINDCNYNIREALYNTDWYNLNASFRKTLVIFMCNTLRYRNLKASVSYIASYELFTGIIKGSYTYMNLLLRSFSR